MKTRAMRLLLVGGAVVAFGAGLAYAAIPGADAMINGCYEKRTGLLRVIDAEAGKKCTQWETPISWSRQYLAGEGLTLTGNVFSVADGSLKAADFSTVDEEGLTSDNIKNESLSGADLENGTVVSGDVQDESLSGEDLENDTVMSGDVHDESLSGEDLENGSVATSDIENESLSGIDIKDESLSGDDLAGGSVATAAIQANAANNVDFSEYRLEPNDPPNTVASATITIPTAGSSPADHRLLVIGQAMVCCANGEVEWELYNGTGPDATPLTQRPYEARFSGAFVMTVSHLFTAPAGEQTIALKVRNKSAPSESIYVTQTSLSVIDLGSV
jgi:hypothetical protein